MAKDDEIDELLANGDMSGPEVDRVWKKVQRERPRPARHWFAWGVPIAVALLIAPLAVILSRATPTMLRDKGGPASVAITADCVSGACAVGGRLVFAVTGMDHAGFLAAYAENDSGDRIWYSPTSEGPLISLAASADRQLAPQQIVIGPEHARAKRWHVHAIALAASESRTEILAGHGALGVLQWDLVLP